MGHFEPATCVDFGEVFVKAPAPAGDAEEEINQGAQRQEQVADDEVFAV